ncbi:MAG TPA: hypothetical protein VMW38_00995, partial [Terriglobia bacterium]|nr:hypothetical protein [Terriglobia bacterium]
MSRLVKVVLLMLLVFLAAGSVFAQTTPPPKSSTPAYLLAILLGFGSGQYYVGENGTPFLIGDLAGWGMEIAGYLVILSDASSASYTSTADTGAYLVLGGAAVLLVSRIWEIVDVFGAVDKARAAGRVAVVPVIDVKRTSY